MLTSTQERVAATGVDLFPETSAPDNVDFYEQLGFVPVAESIIARFGPQVWSMIR